MGYAQCSQSLTKPYIYTFSTITTTSSHTALGACTNILANTCSFQVNSQTSGNSFRYNAVVVDSATTNEISNTPQVTLTVNKVLSFGTPQITVPINICIWPKNKIISANVIGGTVPYTSFAWKLNGQPAWTKFPIYNIQCKFNRAGTDNIQVTVTDNVMGQSTKRNNNKQDPRQYHLLLVRQQSQTQL